MPDEDPVAEFDISGLERFEIRSSCNQHGLWSSGMIEAIDVDNNGENS
jgi:desulfoferrodoxin (superoxide reductase-like protein)